MKLAMITTYATPRNVRRELLESIAARGHDITVVAPEPVDVMAPPLAEFGAHYRRWAVERTSIAPLADFASAGALYRILREVRPDVVLLYQIKAVLLGPTMAKLARTPHVVALINGLGGVFDDRGFGATRKARLARRIYGLSLRNVDTIVFQNTDDPKLLASLGLLSTHARWTVVPGSGVDLEKLQPMEHGPSVPTFTLVSRLLVSKGVRDLAEAARRIRARHANVRFRLVGPTEDNHPDGIARSEIDDWVRAGLVEYLGVSSDIPRILAETSVFVLPSYYREGVPRTNLEALAMGLPIITTDWVGCRDTVEDGENGFLIAPRDLGALVDRIERYLAEPTLVARHGIASRRLAESRFDIRRVNELMVDALQLQMPPRSRAASNE